MENAEYVQNNVRLVELLMLVYHVLKILTDLVANVSVLKGFMKMKMEFA